MNQEFKNIIEIFNTAQIKAVDILEKEFRCPRPRSSNDFIIRCVPIIREANYECSGYKIRPHGIGLEINMAGQIIDFDFGQNGEFNGFDCWRLMEFINKNNIDTSLNTEENIISAINESLKAGDILKREGMGNVYYIDS